MGETLPHHLEWVVRKYTMGRDEMLPPSSLEHVAGNYKLHFQVYDLKLNDLHCAEMYSKSDVST